MHMMLRRFAAAVAVASGCFYAISAATSQGRAAWDGEPPSVLKAGDLLVLGGRSPHGFRATIHNAGEVGIRLASRIDGAGDVLLCNLGPGETEDVAAWPGQALSLRVMSPRHNGAIRVRYRVDDGGLLPMGLWPAGSVLANHR
ncbi:MAG: hypothetical protein AAF235_10235 [Planctomycetota bacterium]